MLNISAISGTGLQQPGQTGISQSADPVSRSIQKQIEYLQQQLQELSANDTMSMEEKQKKRQELEMQINDLTAQLRQRQMEEKKEKLEAAAPSQEDEEQEKMRSMLSAETALNHARIEGSVSTRLNGRVKTLEREIQLDSGRLGSSEGKLKKLTDTKERARDAGNSQARLLGESNKILKEESEENMEKASDIDGKNDAEKEGVFIYTQEGRPSPEEEEHRLTARA